MSMSHAALPPIQSWLGVRLLGYAAADTLTTTETRSMGIFSDVLL